jgi:hypothetical protein
MGNLFYKSCSFFVRLCRSLNYFYENFRRRNFDYFNYIQLSKFFQVPILLSYPANRFYGIHKSLKKKFHRWWLPRKYVVEHGIFWSDDLRDSELKFCRDVVIITMGQQRKDFLNSHGYNCIAIGPFIKYANYFYSSNKRQEVKKRLGKVLLVFPSHSIEGVDAVFNGRQFINEIKNRAKQFDNVLVCLYWKDILDHREKEYIDCGFTVVTAGHRSDSYFLSRLKDLIWLSDMTMSNTLGTHLGYCISLGKPHYLFLQDISWAGDKVEEEMQNCNKGIYEKRLFTFKRLFGTYTTVISDEQQEIVEYYWGK